MKTPDFIGLGMFRSGTRWLADCLSQHPDIFMPPGEANFFVRRRLLTTWQFGLNYYASLFENTSKPDAKICGEITPVYLGDIESPQLIKQYVPHAKLFCILRDQSEVLYSAYRLFLYFNHELFRTGFSFNTFLMYNPQLISELFYVEHIRRYKKLFKSEQFNVLLYSNFKADPGKNLQLLFRYLGVDQTFMPSSTRMTVNSMELSVKKSYALNRRIKLLADSRYFCGVAKILDDINTTYISRQDLPERHRMSENLREIIATIYKEHNKELGDMLDVDLSCWNNAHE